MSFNTTKTIVLLRTLQLTAHNAHHLTQGPSALGDHELLSEIYSSAEEYYDSLVEHSIANDDLPVSEVLSGARSVPLVPKLTYAPDNNLDLVLKRLTATLDYAKLSRAEKDLPEDIDTLLGDMQRDFGTFTYKLKFRLADNKSK